MYVYMCVCMCVCVRACVRACVCACVRACVCVCASQKLVLTVFCSSPRDGLCVPIWRQSTYKRKLSLYESRQERSEGSVNTAVKGSRTYTSTERELERFQSRNTPSRMPRTFQRTLQASLSGTFPPKSAVISYATEGALLISEHLSTEITLTVSLSRQILYSL